MTRQEYLQLVQASSAFQQMEAAMQQKILAANGEEMTYYSGVFMEEQRLLLSAKKGLVTRNDEVVKKLSADIKTVQKKKARADEENMVKNDTMEETKLLGRLDEL